jgi:hypothetical protein
MPRLGRRELTRRYYKNGVRRAERLADDARELERELRRQRRDHAVAERQKRAGTNALPVSVATVG